MPQVKVEQVETVEGCSHEVKEAKELYFSNAFVTVLFAKHMVSPRQVALPASDEYKPLKPRVGKAAKVY